MQLIKNKFYHVSCEDGFVIFQFSGSYSSNTHITPHLLYSIGDMNKHWGWDSFKRADGKNTYPFEFHSDKGVDRRWVNIENRNIREATESEILWLKECIRFNMMLTKEELRNLKLEELC